MADSGSDVGSCLLVHMRTFRKDAYYITMFRGCEGGKSGKRLEATYWGQHSAIAPELEQILKAGLTLLRTLW